MQRRAFLPWFAAAIVVIAAAVLAARRGEVPAAEPLVTGGVEEPAKISPDGARHSRALMYLLR